MVFQRGLKIKIRNHIFNMPTLKKLINIQKYINIYKFC